MIQLRMRGNGVKTIEHIEALCADKVHLRVPPTFKMPKVVVSGGFKVTPRLPSSPQLGKCQPSLPPHPPPSKLPSQPQKGKKKVLLSRRSRRLKLSTHPLKPAVVSSFFYLRGISAGRKVGNEEEEEEEEDDDDVTDVEEMSVDVCAAPENEASFLAKDKRGAVEQIEQLTICDEKERQGEVCQDAEDVEGYLNANDLRSAYRALKKLRSKSPSRASAIRAADRRLVSDMDGQMARWAEYFGQLFTVDPPIEQLHTTGLRAVDVDPPIDETAPSLDEVREAVAKLRGGKAAGVCNISAELLKARGEAMIRGLHAVLTAV
ncbi:hypothetical protein GWK47_005983 [Chionoecetes opilio]|uniref:Uncharacterized protein n=1 Tax=Chionoecetes opilio TaxID=41210 RepID=A0A8J5CY27_CHIOP|nr:hypothetical protein GWK47_005983 [Chionoecetes opilio]